MHWHVIILHSACESHIDVQLEMVGRMSVRPSSVAECIDCAVPVVRNNIHSPTENGPERNPVQRSMSGGGSSSAAVASAMKDLPSGWSVRESSSRPGVGKNRMLWVAVSRNVYSCIYPFGPT